MTDTILTIIILIGGSNIAGVITMFICYTESYHLNDKASKKLAEAERYRDDAFLFNQAARKMIRNQRSNNA